MVYIKGNIKERKSVAGRICRRVVGCLATLMTVWALLPLVSGVVNVGVVIPAVVGVLGAVWGFSAVRIKRRRRRGMMIAIIAVLAVLAIMAGIMIGLMAHAATRRPTDAPATVVVLGAAVRNSETPSRMLRDRLDTALVYLREHPQAMCIVTGGKGSDEPCTEASVMALYLQQQGIAADRILLEERATSTRENMEFSMQIIRDNSLPTDLVVATQEFHQYRAACLARRAGAGDISALTCASPFHLLFCYWVRECAAIGRMWLTGH